MLFTPEVKTMLLRNHHPTPTKEQALKVIRACYPETWEKVIGDYAGLAGAPYSPRSWVQACAYLAVGGVRLENLKAFKY